MEKHLYYIFGPKYYPEEGTSNYIPELEVNGKIGFDIQNFAFCPTFQERIYFVNQWMHVRCIYEIHDVANVAYIFDLGNISFY